MFESTKSRLRRDGGQLAADVHDTTDNDWDDEDRSGDYNELDTHQGISEAQPGDYAAERMHERHAKLMDTLKDERDRQAENRWQMAKDEDYVDGLQWEPEDAQALMERGQAPLAFNKTKPMVEWVLGTEKRTRIDFKVLPREQDDEKGAETKTKVLKYVGDTNRVQFHRSAAFKECVSAGLGWLEDGVSNDPEADIIYSGHESWRNLLHDSRDRQFDTSRMRYIHRTKALDLDIALAMFPKARLHLEGTSERADYLGNEEDDIWYLGERLTNSIEEQARHAFGERSAFVGTSYVDAGRRDVVRLIESWYRVPEPVEFFANGPFAGKPCNPADPQHVAAKQSGATTFNHVALRMRCMISTEDAPLWDGASWYRHNRFPFTPLWCYRRARDGMPYGIVRGIRDIQDDYNKRRSKALHVLSVNRVIIDGDAVDDIEQVRREAARADGVLVKNRGGELRIEKAAAEVTGNLELMQADEQLMQDVSGVTAENLGHQSNAISGRAILARQDQGSMVTASIFDNLRLGIQLQGEKQLSLCEQFYSEPKVIRLVGQRKPTEWLTINQIDPQTGEVHDDITARQADFMVGEQDYRANLQQAAFEQLSDMMTKVGQYAPQVVVNLLDLLVDLADIPNKDEFVSRIRKLTGQTDPSKPPTPEEQAAMQKQAAKADMQEQIQLATLEAQLTKLKNEGAKIGAQTVTEHVNALLQAITAGAQVVAAPGLAPVADAIAKQSGWNPEAGQDPNIVQPAPQAMPAMPAPMQPQPELAGAM